ncbi:MAG TPA: radical SAM protein, partial [Thermoanaerobaculia bacterium]|nr:radical SAM protein [Thermoanaerobaculia bacterium]
TVESLVREALSLEAQGVSELVLISQDTTRYGEDVGLGRKGLATLVSTLLRETSLPWVRFLYAYPKTLHESVLRLMSEEPRFVPYVDIPLQHVSRRVLAAMRRGGDPKSFARMFAGMRETVPGIALRTTFIAGFPSETEADFEELLAFVEEVEFDHLGVFPYSPEPGSGAQELGDPVPAEVKVERCAAVMEAQREISRRKNRALKGKVHEAILEGVSAESELLLEGRLKRQAPEIDGKLLINDVPEGFVPRPGSVVKVRVTEAHDYDLVGRIVA